jgi:hypothetical protein
MDKALYLGNHNTERNRVTKQMPTGQVMQQKYRLPQSTGKTKPVADQPEACQP